ncbi:MAG: RNA degradosome polyphosphate kinase, partial [Chloroflexi bacterium]|nr:RNA degradosome polyphosphate kinase [Chloroflexota bacterium]
MVAPVEQAEAEETQQPTAEARYVNPELSRISYFQRVLKESTNQREPLLERVKLLAISDSQLDEFLMVRVSGLMDEVEAGVSS